MQILLGLRLVALSLTALLLIMAGPVRADDRCTHLGIATVNWKSPWSDETGVLVLGVNRGCVASMLGIQAGEFITALNGKPIANQYDLELLAGTFPAGGAFSITLKDSQGHIRTVKREAIPEHMLGQVSYATPPEISGEWLEWFKWAGIFLLVTFTLTPLVFYLLSIGTPEIMIGGAGRGIYEEFKSGGRNYVGAGIKGGLTAVIILLGIACIGPAGFVYNLYQPLMAELSDADQKVCCVDDKGKYAVSPDGRWLAIVKPTPENYFGLGDKIARTPYVAALVDLQSGQFVSWQNTADARWFGVAPDGDSALQGVEFATHDHRPYANWDNGFRTLLAFPGKTVEFPDTSNSARSPQVRFTMHVNENGKFEFTEAATRKSFTLDPKQAWDRGWLSADGRVLALVTRPYAPDKEHDGWFTQTYHTLRNFFLADWTVTFWEVGAQRKLATYHGHGFDDNRFLEASLDGRRWIMVKDNGFAFVFDLTRKLEPAYAKGGISGPIYWPETSHGEIAFYHEPARPTEEDRKTIASLLDHYPSEIMEANPQVAGAFKGLLGKSYAHLMEILQVETPAVATPDGGLTFTLCKAHACGDVKLVVYITPALKLGAMLFHNDGDIGLPEAPVKGEDNPDGYSRLVLYEDSAYPLRMLWPLYQAAYADLGGLGMDDFAVDESHGRVSPRFWVVGKMGSQSAVITGDQSGGSRKFEHRDTKVRANPDH